jgi:hypothetical protein
MTGFFDTNGYVRVKWNNISPDPAFYSFRVYRRQTDDNLGSNPGNWNMIWETTTLLSSYEFHDYTALSGQWCQYAIVQVANRFGTQVESTRGDAISAPVFPQSSNYWLLNSDIDAGNPNGTAEQYNIRLFQVTDDSFTNEYDTATLNLLGRGRHVDVGTYLGKNGTLTFKIYDQAYPVPLSATAQRLMLENAASQNFEMYLRTPFGEIYKVSLGNIQFGRIAGVGSNEYMTATVPYMEVA